MANPLRYWDALAQKGWEEEVLSTIDSDKKQVLRSVINEYASAARQSASAESETVAFDFGAGSGRYLHSLAPAFDRVIAVDISPKLVDMMQALVGSNGWTHVQCGVEDLARPTLRGVYPRAHFGVCANVLLSPDTSHHTAIMQEVARRLVPGAALLVVAPSTEAALYIRQRLVDARLEKPMTPKAAADGIANGVFKRGGVRTKHWLREELELFARRCGFRLERIGKVEFGWASEVDDERLRNMGVPLSLNVPPHPWDHLAIFRRLADGTNGVEPKPEGLLSIRSDFEARGCLTSCMLSRGGDNEAAV